MTDYRKKSYYKYLDDETKELLDRISPAVEKTPKKPTSQEKLAQFMATYKEPYSFGKKLKSDVGTFMTSIPKIPGALWDTVKQSLAPSGMYDPSKALWKQEEGLTGSQILQRSLKNAKLASLHMIPGFPIAEAIGNLPYVRDTKFGQAIPKTPISEMANKFLLDSMIKNTGKWVYNPEAEGRKWLPKLSEPTSRWQDFKERPFTTALEDISNVSIVGAPIMKATGLSAKMATAVKATKPYAALKSKVITPLTQRGKFLDIVSDMKQKQFQRLEELKHGKLVESLKGVSKENQPELQALITRRAQLLPENIPKTTGKTTTKVTNLSIKAQDLANELKSAGTTINPDGTVTLYHFTSPKNKALIESTGKMFGKEDGIFFSTKLNGQATGYGKAVVKVDVPLDKLQLDDIFKNEAHLRIPTKKIGEIVDMGDIPVTKQTTPVGNISDNILSGTKVVDKIGLPKTVYHGTIQDFKTFKSGDIGFHFGSTKTQALTKGKIVKEVYLDIKNPIIINKDLGNWNAQRLSDELLGMGKITNEQYNLVKNIKSYGEGYTDKANIALRNILTENGYDGIKYTNWFEKGANKPSWVVFNNKQIIPIDEFNKATTPIAYPSEYIAKQQSLTKALTTYERSAALESNSLIKKGLLKESQQTNAVWRDLTTEFGKSIDELKALGIDDPIYYPHTFEKYNVSGVAKLRSKKASYLKTKKGVTAVEGKGIEEPIISIPKHKIEYITQKTVGQALKQIEDSFGKPIVKGEILPGYAQWNPKQFNLQFYPVEGRAIGTAGVLKPMVSVKKFQPKMQIPKFLNDEIVRMVTPITGIAKTFGAVWDTATNTWKISVLALSPRWVFNNIMGNSMLNAFAGVVNPASYIEAGKRLFRGRRQAKTQNISFARAMSRQHVPEGAWEGLYRAEARAATPAAGGSWLVNNTAPVTGMWKKLGYKISAVPKAMYNLNSTIESFYRTAHYIDKVNFGLSPTAALASVNEFLFNYSRLSVMEKAFARRALPFYAWQKNITRLAVSYPFKHPTGMVVLAKLQKVTDEAQKDDADNKFIPDWFKSYIKTPLKDKNTGDNLYLSTRGINPFADIGALSGGMASYLSAINPLLKVPLERATGQSFYKEKSFTSPYRGFGSNEKILPSWWRHILSNFPQYTMIENLVKPYAKYDTGEPMLDKEGNPKYEKSKILTVLKMFGINLSPYNIEEMTQQEAERLMREQTVKSSYGEKLRKFQQQEGGN